VRMLVSKNLIAKDLTDQRPHQQHQAKTCFQCGRGFSKGVQPNGRFCDVRCVEAFDNGLVITEPKHPFRWEHSRSPTRGTPTIVMGSGFAIQCAQCKQAFSSKGLRCCSPECERQLRETQTVKVTMAEAAATKTFVNRKCEAPGCGNDIPRYVGVGKKRRESRTRFCSPACQRRARRAA
jgi:hypothetical protein